MAQQTVSDVMTTDIVGVSADASVTEAAELMRDHDIGDVMVLEDGHVRGMVTDRDLTVRVLAAHRVPDSTAVADVISADVASIGSDAPISEAVQLMRDRAVRRLPVVDADGRPAGIVSIGDLAVSEDPASALADISVADPNS